MNSAERDVIKQQYKDEQRALRELKKIYQQASKDLAGKIEELAIRYDETGLQSVIYQKQYQEAIKKQVDEGLKALLGNEYKTVNDFLKGSYENGFIGNVYMLHKQDIPLTLPIDQEKIVEALKIDSQLSRQYYAADPLKGKLGENYDQLKFRVRSSVSRGIAQGSSWQEVARNLAVGMNSPMKRAMNDSMRIARTEGHRINQQGFLDAGYKAKERGAQVVKQWDSTLDGRTRPEHRQADGQIREWDEDFDVGGEKLKAPGIGGSARNVVNCRCCLLQRPVEAMNEAELETLKKRAEYFGLDKTKDFEDFKKKYLASADEYGAIKGALNNKNDPYGIKRDAHANRYYEAVRKRNKDAEIKTVATNTSLSYNNVEQIYNHVFIEEHLFDDGSVKRFAPSYDMSESWRRLREGKNIQQHDITLMKHELMESELMKAGLTYEQAHERAQKEYNYHKELIEYLAKRGDL